MSDRGRRLKKQWMKLPPECFEPLTFGELKLDEKFIFLRQPSEAGGLKKPSRLFTKNRMETKGSERPTGSAIHFDGQKIDVPDWMSVLKVIV